MSDLDIGKAEKALFYRLYKHFVKGKIETEYEKSTKKVPNGKIKALYPVGMGCFFEVVKYYFSRKRESGKSLSL